jgi:uncharacterized protein YkwD
MRTAGLSLVLAASALAGMAGTALAWDPGAFSPSDEQLLFSLTNQDRASDGLNALVNDTYLHKEAEWRAQDMGDRNYFSHAIPPDGAKVFTFMQADGYCFNVAGENIGLSTYSDDSATSRIEVAFMGSTPHRANILGTWAHLGVGAYKAADGRKLYAVLFSIPCGVTVPPPAVAATPVPTDPPAPEVTPAPVAPPAPPAPPAPRATARPAAAAATTAASPTPSDTPAPTDGASPSASPSAAPSWTPGAKGSAGSIGSAPSPDATATTTTTATNIKTPSLRVHQKAVTDGPIDSLFHSLFGRLFGP